MNIATRQAERWIEIQIKDSGQGIESDNLAQIFEPFFSTKDTGTGLGLCLTQQIVQEHGGTIEVSSVQGRGSTFTIKLPMRRE